MANKKKGTVAELTSTSSGGSTNKVAKEITPTPAQPLLTTVSGTQSTANTVGSQQPYSFKNLKTGSKYKPAQNYKSVGDVSYNQFNAVDAPELNNYSSVGDVKYNQYSTGNPLNYQNYSAGTPLNYQNYSTGNQLQLGNYNYTPQELLQLNRRGLDANSQNIISEYQRMMNGDGGYTNYLNSAKQNSLDALNQQYNDAARNYYQQYKSNQNKLPEQLSRLGVTGGGSETALLGLMNNYSGNLYNNESARAQQASNMNAQYDQLMADYNRGLAEQMANAYLNMAKGLQSENWSRQASNNQGVNEANRFNVNAQNDARMQNWNRANTVSDQNAGLANEAREKNWNRTNTINDQNVGLANEAREKNWNRTNTVSDLNTEQANQALYQNWQNNQDISNRNVGLANDLALQVWQNLQNISNQNTETANQAVYQNWQNAQNIANQNTGLANDASLTNWNWGNQVRQYNNQGQNEARQNNTAYNISEMQTLRNRQWETMDKEQAHEWEQAGIKDERMYNMALYMLENGGNASMVKKMLGLTDKQGKNLEKAWKKAQKSNSSSGGGGGTRGYYRSSGGGTTTSDFPEVGDPESTSINPWVDPDPKNWTLKGDDATWGKSLTTSGKVPQNAYTDTATGSKSSTTSYDEYKKKTTQTKAKKHGGENKLKTR